MKNGPPKFNRIAICGIARNVAHVLAASLSIINRLSEAATESCEIIVTNDNSDETTDILSRWANAATTRSVISLDGLADAMPVRVDRLAFARNCYLSELKSRSWSPDLVVVLDLDGPNAELDVEAVGRAVAAAPPGWGALFANQINAYYDVYALRRPNWVENDIWLAFERRTRWMRSLPIRAADRLTARQVIPRLKKNLAERLVYSKQFKIPAGSRFIDVHSAFGGLGIYRFEAIEGAWYGSRGRAGEAVCEHTIFHQQIRNKNYSLFICPSLVNKAPAEHLGARSGAPMPRALLSV
jgi:hypothetical protein